ncbi:hypothetical protein GDO81_017423 [Engystomops pustulosus]|uniref:Uncharacterized protein n=1 Tax=Engystomops pustulosus TaxID=76066 RepID=A0AAV7ADR7_ENGPU|nr:hypothetical protein GDO81_017423 [Engystomops pustulosus]
MLGGISHDARLRLHRDNFVIRWVKVRGGGGDYGSNPFTRLSWRRFRCTIQRVHEQCLKSKHFTIGAIVTCNFLDIRGQFTSQLFIQITR